MAKATHHVPNGLTAITPQIVTRDARALLSFLESVFGAKTGDLLTGPDGKSIMHAHSLIDGAALFVAEPFGQAPATQSNTFLYVKDVDAAVKRAEKAGAKVMSPPNDMPWGDRWSMLVDPWGNGWQIATHIEDVPPDEMKRRMAQMAPAQ